MGAACRRSSCSSVPFTRGEANARGSARGSRAVRPVCRAARIAAGGSPGAGRGQDRLSRSRPGSGWKVTNAFARISVMAQPLKTAAIRSTTRKGRHSARGGMQDGGAEGRREQAGWRGAVKINRTLAAPAYGPDDEGISADRARSFLLSGGRGAAASLIFLLLFGSHHAGRGILRLAVLGIPERRQPFPDAGGFCHSPWFETVLWATWSKARLMRDSTCAAFWSSARISTRGTGASGGAGSLQLLDLARAEHGSVHPELQPGPDLQLAVFPCPAARPGAARQSGNALWYNPRPRACSSWCRGPSPSS